MKARFWFVTRSQPRKNFEVEVEVGRRDTAEFVASVAIFDLWFRNDLTPRDVRLITGRYLPEAA